MGYNMVNSWSKLSFGKGAWFLGCLYHKVVNRECTYACTHP